MKEVIALLAGNLEADVTVSVSRDNGLLTFAANDDGSEFHRPPPRLCSPLWESPSSYRGPAHFCYPRGRCWQKPRPGQNVLPETSTARRWSGIATACRNQLPQPSLRTDPPSALFPVLVGLRMLRA